MMSPTLLGLLFIGKACLINGQAGKPIATGLGGAYGIAISASGYAFVSEFDNNGITRVTLADGSKKVVVTSLSSPQALAIPANGTILYVLEHGAGRLTRVSLLPYTRVSRTTITTGFYNSPQGLALSSDEKSLFVSEYYGGVITQVTIATGAKRTINTNSANGPQGLVLSADGKSLFVSEFSTGTISQLTIATGVKVTIATDLKGPLGLALNENSLMVSESSAGRITQVMLASGVKTILANYLRDAEGMAMFKGQLLVSEYAVGQLTELLIISPPPPSPPPASVQTCDDSFMLENTSICADTLLQYNKVTSPVACCDLCRIEPTCVAFTLEDNSCKLKSWITPFERQPSSQTLPPPEVQPISGFMRIFGTTDPHGHPITYQSMDGTAIQGAAPLAVYPVDDKDVCSILCSKFGESLLEDPKPASFDAGSGEAGSGSSSGSVSNCTVFTVDQGNCTLHDTLAMSVRKGSAVGGTMPRVQHHYGNPFTEGCLADELKNSIAGVDGYF